MNEEQIHPKRGPDGPKLKKINLIVRMIVCFKDLLKNSSIETTIEETI
jgi:hypothetical protein